LRASQSKDLLWPLLLFVLAVVCSCRCLFYDRHPDPERSRRGRDPRILLLLLLLLLLLPLPLPLPSKPSLTKPQIFPRGSARLQACEKKRAKGATALPEARVQPAGRNEPISPSFAPTKPLTAPQPNSPKVAQFLRRKPTSVPTDPVKNEAHSPETCQIKSLKPLNPLTISGTPDH
jgi:hypothetical protein